ncbi:MAG TPA: alpha/beta fold hydrolase, partial [Bacteroidia bacterium]|nr:alpha/beta fold hydrolase [Bacteroidia bacterium]
MELNYYQLGSGKPLLILHGLFGQSDNWLTLAKRWATTHTVYVIDLRNHGKSPHDIVFTHAAMAQDVVAFIERNSLQDVTLMGHSLGGKVAMYVALNYQAIQKLIVVDIAPRYYKPHHQSIINGLYAVPLHQLTSRNMAEPFLEPFIDDAGTRQFLLKNLYWKTDTQLAWRFNLDAIASNIDQVGAAVTGKPFQRPALFINGGKSNYITSNDSNLINILVKIIENEKGLI